MTQKPKVFGIGLNKTGTTTLGECLRELGYSPCSYDLEMLRKVVQGELDDVLAFVDGNDSLEDLPWPLIYRELDERFPGAKFILTVRASGETWLRSLRRHWVVTGPTEFRELVYGRNVPSDRDEEYIAFYERHNADVRRYFADRPDDLLEVCWETGSGWEQLCAFLGHDVPDRPFPHANRTPSFARLVARRLRRVMTR